MASANTSPRTARSASHAAPDPALAHDAGAAPGGPAAAVHAALAASPGSTVAVIAGAAGTGRPAARDALLAMEKDGTATRVKGARPGISDTWTLAGATHDDAETNPAAGQGSQPGADPAGSRGGEDVPDAETGTASRGQQDSDTGAETGTSPAPDLGTEQAGPHDNGTSAGHDPADTAPDVPGGAPEPSGPQAADAGDAPEDQDTVGEGSEEAGDKPDPALVTSLTGRLGQIRNTADAAVIILAGNADLRAVLANLDEITEQAAQARRELKAATGGQKAPAVRPGGLRDKVLAHLDAHPGSDFTPHEIHKVLGHSSGAIANALDTLVKLGGAEVAADKPRRFRRAAQPAGASPGADSADGAPGSAKLAGAA